MPAKLPLLVKFGKEKRERQGLYRQLNFIN
jgi:hypothetical protein